MKKHLALLFVGLVLAVDAFSGGFAITSEMCRRHDLSACSSQDCHAISTGVSGFCETNDCRAIVQNVSGFCDTNDCRAVVQGVAGFCDTNNCRGYVQNVVGFCD